MHLDSALGDADSAGALFVEQPGHDIATDLVLSRGESVKAPARLKLRGVSVLRLYALPKRALDGFAEAALVKRLLQKVHRSSFHRLNTSRDGAVARQKNDWDFPSEADQLLLYLKAGHLGHLQVEKDTNRPVLWRVSEKFPS